MFLNSLASNLWQHVRIRVRISINSFLFYNSFWFKFFQTKTSGHVNNKKYVDKWIKFYRILSINQFSLTKSLAQEDFLFFFSSQSSLISNSFLGFLVLKKVHYRRRLIIMFRILTNYSVVSHVFRRIRRQGLAEAISCRHPDFACGFTGHIFAVSLEFRLFCTLYTYVQIYWRMYAITLGASTTRIYGWRVFPQQLKTLVSLDRSLVKLEILQFS